ncbi:uncharacterized mitochondrial protein-like protein [Tanacetum coccineum]
MESCDLVGTSMEIKDKLDLDQNGSLIDVTKYRSMIGALMYLTSSRPDIVHATCLCARYQAKPTEKHLKEVKSIFCYLRGTILNCFELTGFSDADYAGCKDTFKSTFGGAQFLGEKLREQIRHDDEIVLARVKTSTLEILIEDIQVRHRSDMKNLLNKIHKLKNHKGGPPPPDYIYDNNVKYNCKDEDLASISLSGDLIIHNLSIGFARAIELKAFFFPPLIDSYIFWFSDVVDVLSDVRAQCFEGC